MRVIAFTIGNTESYERGLQEAQQTRKPLLKIGRTDDYDGGAVFRTPDDAQAFINRHNYPYSVYQLTLGSEGEIDWSHETELGYGFLLVSSPISKIIDLS